ncbi:MAG: vitamin K epoxide reductase family protein [Gammaproteobacteria bacterium]|nr:vitamin K epoxide reductase family protein [Gammaproteobacteria bacterium]
MTDDSPATPASRTERKLARKAQRDGTLARTPAPGARVRGLAGIAGLGLLLSLYLAVQHWLDADLPFCTEGSGCDLVQHSRYAVLLGIPLAVWGVAMYAVLAALLLRARAVAGAWAAAWLVAWLGVSASVYFTVATAIEINAYCPWCMVSLALLIVLLAGTSVSRPPALTGFRWRTWLPTGIVLAVAMLTLVHMHYRGVFDPAAGPERPYLRALAEHLSAAGVKFYGAYWCPHCQEQKQLFGASAHRLPYVECSPNGRGAPRAAACETAQISGYPTWIIGARRIEEVLEPHRLARATGFDWQGPSPAGTGAE